MSEKPSSKFARRFGILVLVWMATILLSVFGFWHHYRMLPPLHEIPTLNLLTGILSLPYAFVHLLTLKTHGVVRMAGSATGLLMLAYWATVLWAQYRFVRAGGRHWLLLVVAICVLSSYYWHVYAQGMIGI